MGDRVSKVVVFGGSGMVGRNLLEQPDFSFWEWDAPSSAELDLRDRRAVIDYLDATAPDLIVHCAGKVGGIHANMHDPYGFLHDNALIGLNVIDAARAVGVPRLINLASSCIYSPEAPNPLTEDSILSGALEATNEGYALAKIAALKLCAYLSAQHSDLRYKTLIPCNLYGPYDHFGADRSHLIAAAIVKLHRAKAEGIRSVEVWGDGTARREFMYAGDLAEFIVKAVHRFDDLPLLMNVGVGEDHEINHYYEAVAKVVDWDGEFHHDLSKPSGMRQKLVDVGRQRALGWQPSTSLDAGLQAAYIDYLSSEDQPEANPS